MMNAQLLHKGLFGLLFILMQMPGYVLSQSLKSVPKIKFITANADLFNTNCFIENNGQYAQIDEAHDIGKISFAYQGFTTPVLFSSSGILYIINKRKNLSHEKWVKPDREEREFNNIPIETKYIKIIWLGSNPDAQIMPEQQQQAYHTYGQLRANSFNKITIQNLYKNIDLVYSISKDGKRGYEYSFVIHPKGNVDDIQMQFWQCRWFR